jgi:hypothetical protein
MRIFTYAYGEYVRGIIIEIRLATDERMSEGNRGGRDLHASPNKPIWKDNIQRRPSTRFKSKEIRTAVKSNNRAGI